MSSNTVFPCYSKELDDGSEDLNNNSFLSKSERQTDSTKENDDKQVVLGDEVSHDDEIDDHKEVEVGSINMEDNFEANEANSIGQYSCHLCSFVCIQRNEFSEHLLTHYTYSCDQCDYASRTEGRLKRHVKDFHSSNSPENFSGQKVPSNNPKSLKCKHCGIISSTKEKHWSHQRTHLDVSKCLQCPKCPFITEYKHHLEYHIRNHEKIKPYKCSKCQYRCVNKSMLNSHKKSHSNVYQFRCADCSYASKYCHSLKQHLTRHGHQPAPVLNEDGSLPSYDNSNEILSMKRGPNNRNLSSQNSASSHQDPFVSLQIPASSTKPDGMMNQSAFSVFKKDHIDSILSWTLNQCYSIPLTKFMPTSFPIIPPIPSLISLPSVPPNLRDNPLFTSNYQSSALDLSLKVKPGSEQPPAHENNRPLECAICQLRFCDQHSLDGHLLYHGRVNNFRCTKCGNMFNNFIDFFSHLQHMCRE